MKDLSKIAPKLSKIKKECPFGVPPNYFDDFNAKLQAKIEAEIKPAKHRPVLIRYLKPAIGIAASLAIIFMLVYLPLNKMNVTQTATTDSEYIGFSLENEYIAFLENIDVNTFLSVIENGEEDPVSDEGFLNYLCDNLSDYDIYFESE